MGGHLLKAVEVYLSREIAGRGMVGGCNRPCHGQLTRWIDLTCQQVGNGITTFHTGLPGTQDGIRITAPRGCLNHRTGIDNHNHGFTGGVEGIAYVLY